MDYDKGLVSALLREGSSALVEIRQGLPSLGYLEGDGRIAFEFMIEFNSSFGHLPSIELIQQHTGIDLDPDPLTSSEDLAAPPAWWLEQLIDRHTHKRLKVASVDLVRTLETGNPREALDVIEASIKALRRELVTNDAGIQNIGQLKPEVWQYYQDVKNGKRGVQTPWKGINDATLGFWPGDLVLFVARSGVGKTWASIIMALEAWKNKEKVLFATTEMTRITIAMRMLAVKYKFNYNDFRWGRLSAFQEKHFEEQMGEILEDQYFEVAGGNFDFRVESFTALVEDRKPGLCVLDGAYLLKVDGRTRTERAANAFDEVKRVGINAGVPMLCTMQFNRNTKTNQINSADLSNIGLTDVGGWNASLAYAMMQTEEDEASKVMIFDPMKVREGVGKQIRVQWDLDTMSLAQLESETEEDSDANNTRQAFATSQTDDEVDLPF